MSEPTSRSSEPLDQLKTHLAEAADLQSAAAVLSWDQETFMPEGGAAARSRQLSTLQRLAHEAFTRDAVGALLDDLASPAEDGAPRDDTAALVRVTRRDYERARKVPSALVARLAQASSEAKQAWKAARADDDFDAFAPHLERLVTLSREKAEALGYEDTPYDALLEEYEPGTRTADVAPLFETLREELVPLVEAIAEAEQVDDACLHGDFAPDAQQQAGEEVIRAFGYDFQRGRQDRSAHPSYDRLLDRRRAAHHALRPAVFRDGLLCDAPRSRARPLRTGRGRRPGAHPAGGRCLAGLARKPVAPLGKPRRA